MHFGGRRLGLHRHQRQEECVHHVVVVDYLSSLLRAGVQCVPLLARSVRTAAL